MVLDLSIVVVLTIIGANILITGSSEANASSDMSANFTSGINSISEQIPTILLVGAIVILLGVLVILMTQTKKNLRFQTEG